MESWADREDDLLSLQRVIVPLSAFQRAGLLGKDNLVLPAQRSREPCTLLHSYMPF